MNMYKITLESAGECLDLKFLEKLCRKNISMPMCSGNTGIYYVPIKDENYNAIINIKSGNGKIFVLERLFYESADGSVFVGKDANELKNQSEHVMKKFGINEIENIIYNNIVELDNLEDRIKSFADKIYNNKKKN